jgi:hypothetical protein
MTRRTFVAVGLISLFLAGSLHLFWPPAKAGEATPAQLSGKPVVVLAKDGLGYTLEKADVRQLGARAFVVGRVMKDSPYTKEQFSGATVWVPVDAITELVELEPIKPAK